MARAEAVGAIANEQHLLAQVSHLSRRSGSIKGERRRGLSREELACFCILMAGSLYFIFRQVFCLFYSSKVLLDCYPTPASFFPELCYNDVKKIITLCTNKSFMLNTAIFL